MSIYRRIYEKQFGPIPVDENGRTYEIHHIDGDHENNDIDNLSCVTLQEHYDIHFAQGDYGACFKMAIRMSRSATEISQHAQMAANSRVANGTHNFLGPENNNRKVTNNTHPWISGDIQRKTNKRRIADKSHNFLGTNNPVFTQITNKTHPSRGENGPSAKVSAGTHHWLGNTNVNSQIEKGIHSSQLKKVCEHCGLECSTNMYGRWHGNRCKSANFAI